MRRFLPFLLFLAGPAARADEDAACRARIEEVRAYGGMKLTLPVDHGVIEQTWLMGVPGGTGPRVERGYRAEIDSVAAVYEVTAKEARVVPPGLRGKPVALTSLPAGSRVIIAADEKLPATAVTEVLAKIPSGLEIGLVVRKPGAVVAQAHQKTYPFSPRDLEKILADAFDEVGTAPTILSNTYLAEYTRLVKACPDASTAMKMAAGGGGVDVTMPALADAATRCGCRRMELDRAVSMILFWTWAPRGNAFLPLSRADVGKNGETVGEFARRIAQSH